MLEIFLVPTTLFKKRPQLFFSGNFWKNFNDTLFRKSRAQNKRVAALRQALLKGTFFTEQLRWLLLIILDYVIFYQTRPAHPWSRRITSTLADRI